MGAPKECADCDGEQREKSMHAILYAIDFRKLRYKGYYKSNHACIGRQIQTARNYDDTFSMREKIHRMEKHAEKNHRA